MASKLPREKQEHLLSFLEASSALCGLCNVSFFFFLSVEKEHQAICFEMGTLIFICWSYNCPAI